MPSTASIAQWSHVGDLENLVLNEERAREMVASHAEGTEDAS